MHYNKYNILEKNDLINNVEICLIKTHEFINKYVTLINGHNTDFIIDDLWCKLIPKDIHDDLIMFDDNDIAKLACGDVNKKYKRLY